MQPDGPAAKRVAPSLGAGRPGAGAAGGVQAAVGRRVGTSRAMAPIGVLAFPLAFPYCCPRRLRLRLTTSGSGHRLGLRSQVWHATARGDRLVPSSKDECSESKAQAAKEKPLQLNVKGKLDSSPDLS